MKPSTAFSRLAVSSAVALVLFTLLLSGVSEPVEGTTRTYTAKFIDISGLYEGADVRVHGVLVGRVLTTGLIRTNEETTATVEFTVDSEYGIVADSRVAVKFLTLTGSRYLDVHNPAENYSADNLVTDIPTSMTVPSFDVTRLFNGLQPVIATLSPEDLNEFAANTANFLAGDGSGLAPILTSIHRLTRFVADRQQVISTLMQNLVDAGVVMESRAEDLAHIIHMVNVPLDAFLTVLDELRKSQLYGPGFTEPLLRLMTYAGFHKDADIDTALDTALNNIDRTIDAFKLIPVMWENIPPPVAAGEPQACARGRAELPTTVDILLNGQRVTLCNR